MKCIRCKNEIPEGSAFCNHCGKNQTVEKKVHRRGNGTGSVYKRPDRDGWCASITLGKKFEDGHNKFVRKTKSGFKTKKEALEYISHYNDSQQKKCPTIQQLWEQYENGAYQNLSVNRQVAMHAAWVRWEPLQFRTIDSLTVADLQKVVSSKTSTFYPARGMKDIMSHFYNMAEVDGFVNRNLAKHIVLPALEETIPNPFTPDEQKILWEDYSNGNTFTGYILLMIYTSMMPGEVLKCKKEHIDWDKREIFGAGLKTAIRKSSPIVLADIIIPVLHDLCDKCPNEYIFRWRSDETFRKEFKNTIERLNLRKDLTPYSCRHTTATALVAAEIQPNVIQQVMRHSKFSSTQRYIHITNDDAINAVNQIG